MPTATTDSVLQFPPIVQFAILAAALWFVTKVLEGVNMLLRTAKGGGSSDVQNSRAEALRAIQSEVLTSHLAASVLPLMDRQTEILNELRLASARQTELVTALKFEMGETRAQMLRTHQIMHELVGKVQELISAIPKRLADRS